ncbi:MAG TPA: peptidylprolyl isomerase, partial [Verrucomicrobiaceae bacterium]
MRFIRSFLVCAALGLAANLPAQSVKQNTPKQDSPQEVAAKASAEAKKAGATDEEAAKAAKKAAAEEKRRVHLVCAIEFKFGHDSGDVIFELFPEDAPKTVENFRQHADKGFYNGLAVHRAVKDYLVQTGDPASRDDKARETWGLTQESTIPAEIKRGHTVGAVAMARRSDKVNPDKKSDSSQFYFALGNLSSLDGQYTVFG